MAYSPEYEKRRHELSSWFKRHLIDRCADLGHYGVSGGRNGLGGWTCEELRGAILRSEFPQEASDG